MRYATAIAGKQPTASRQLLGIDKFVATAEVKKPTAPKFKETSANAASTGDKKLLAYN